MSAVKKIAESTSVILLGKIAGKFLGLITTILLARYLSVELFGQYSLALEFIGLLLFLNDFGVSLVLPRELTQKEKQSEELIGNSLGLKLFLGIFSVIASIFIANLAGYQTDTLLILYIFSLTLFTGSVSSVFSSIFQAKLKMVYVVLVEFVQRLIFLALVFYAISINAPLALIIVFSVFSTVVSVILNYYFARGVTKISIKLDFQKWVQIIKIGAPLGLSLLFLAIYNRIDVLMLSLMVNLDAVGRYSAAYRLTWALAIIPDALAFTLFPIMSGFYKKSEEALKKTHALAFRYLTIIFVPIAFGTTILSERILFHIYGADYLNEGIVLTLIALMWGALLIFLNLISSNMLNSIHRQNFLVNVTANLLLIPRYSFFGAAIATLFTEIVTFILFYVLVKKFLYTISLKEFIKPAMASLTMVLVLISVQWLSLFILIPLGALVYFAAFFLLKGFTEEDKAILKKVQQKN